MQNKVFSYIESHQMIQPGDTVIAGVSGGADSVAMLFLLSRYTERVPFELKVLHVHHGIRGAEADRDCRFVEKLCRELEVECGIRYFDVPALASRWKKGEEETGRLVRREALMQALGAREKEPGKVKAALAHHMDDLAETVLFHLCRGTGLRGLAAIRPVQGCWIRPLLGVTRQEIEAFLKEKGIPYVTDSTNLENDYTRNRIRHEVLPVLTGYVNPEAVSHMAEASGRLLEAEEYLQAVGERRLAEYACRQPEGWLLLLRLAGLPHIEISYAVRHAIEMTAPSRKDIQECHIEAVISLFGKQAGKKISLPYGLEARRVYRGILLTKKRMGQVEASEKTRENEFPLRIPGETKTPYGTVSAAVIPYSGQQIIEKKYTKWLDYDKIKGALSIRGRKSGDYIPLSDTGPDKLLRRYFIDRKIPQDERERMPLIASGSHILWIVGERISGRCKITSRTRRILVLNYSSAFHDPAAHAHTEDEQYEI